MAGTLTDVKLRDSRPKITGKNKDRVGEQKREWMWQQQSGRLEGEIVIIRVPLVTGNHFASRPADFIPIVRSLQEIHDAGCVHGDIRCFNVVFGKCLIDFDFGGLVDGDDPPRYPKGYEDFLLDGLRMGRAGDLITMAHDWYALVQVIFDLHRVEPPLIALDEPGGRDLLLRLLDEREAMRRRREEIRSLTSRCRFGQQPAAKELADLPNKLLALLKDVDDASWKVELSCFLRKALKRCGLVAGDGV
jgi:hypothetical protein